MGLDRASRAMAKLSSLRLTPSQRDRNGRGGRSDGLSTIRLVSPPTSPEVTDGQKGPSSPKFLFIYNDFVSVSLTHVTFASTVVSVNLDADGIEFVRQ